MRFESPSSVSAGYELVRGVDVQNPKGGNNFITGPLDFVRSWVHLTVRDAQGHQLAEFGAIDPATQEILDGAGVVHTLGNARDEGTLVLEAMPIDDTGEVLVRHQLWR